MSAVKAIAVAAAQGQKIYTLNAANQAHHSQLLAGMTLDADTKAEIQNALAAGKEVTTHQAEITVGAWKGAGYIILDPNTGTGAYKISGGSSGGWLALKYIIGLFNNFYDALSSLAAHLKTPVPQLQTVVKFLQVLKYAYDILDKGMKCTNLSAVIFFVALTTISSLLIVELITAIANPLVAFATGIILDQALDWLMSQSPDCKS